MPTSPAMSRRSFGGVARLLGGAVLLASALVGWWLISDRPGLEGEYFALGEPWEGRVLAREVGEPRLESATHVRAVLMTRIGFSIRWSGWWYVEEDGEHRISLTADDAGYLRLDDELVVDTAGLFDEAIPAAGRRLERGFHRVEIGLLQRDRDSFLEVEWAGPGGEGRVSRLPADDLYAGRPLAVRRALREALSSWPRPYRQLLGVGVLVALLLLVGRRLPVGSRAGRRPPRARLQGRRGRAALLVALFLVTFAVVLPFTGFLLGGDDVMYLSAATFDTKEWFANRYGHVYLLKLFTALTGGDPLVGVRFWWSFAFAATVAALALAVRSVGPGLQLRTLAAALFVLVSQTTVIGLIGTGFADYSAMMFVTVAVAVCLHGLVVEDGRAAPRREWRAFTLGALTFAALRSKEVAAVLLLLPVLFVFADGGISWRRFARRLAWWALGLVAVLVLLMTLDGLVVGDPFFTGGGQGRLEALEKMNFPQGRKPRPNQDWVTTIWPARHDGGDASLRFLWIGVCAAALVAAACRRRVELRLLHLLPIAYLGALVLLYVRLPHPFSPRMLIAITPVACLMTALILHYAGLDEVSWKELLSPAALIPAGLLTGLVCFVFLPYRMGTLGADELLPVALLRRFGWAPDHFMLGVAVPVVVLSATGAFALGAGRPSVRVAALAVVFVAVFGAGFAVSWTSLAQHRAVQTGKLRAYPWRTFAEEIADVPAATIGISRDFHVRLEMTAQARSSLARLALKRRDVWVRLSGDFPADADLAIASRDYWRRWRQQSGPLEGVLADSAMWDPLGLLVLIRPREAATQVEILARLSEMAAEPPDGSEAEGGGRRRLLQQIRQAESLEVRRIRGTGLHAVNLYGDGWTMGRRPAGVVVVNEGRQPHPVSFGLSVEAPEGAYPIRVVVDDGTAETFVFERAGSRQVDLRPAEPGATRLVVVWSDREWTPPGPDERRLGVRVVAPREP